MSDRDWFDDYMDYKLSGCEDCNQNPAANDGCLSCILCVLAVLWFVSRLYC